METYDTPKFYILQHYNGDLSKLGVNDNGCINAYYVNSNGKDKVALGRPEQATRFNTIGQEEPQVYETEDGNIITYSETDGYKFVEPNFNENEREWLYLVSDVLTWKDGIGQYLDDPEVQELAKRLCSEYSQKLYYPSNSSNIGKE